jgi:hypothetical protein
MGTQYGPFTVVGPQIDTGAEVERGQTVNIMAHGVVDFGGAVFGVGAPRCGPNGDNWATPADYPAPELRKNSLICAIGGRWYQGGSAMQFVAETSGRVYLAANDKDPEDNSRGWRAVVEIS